MAFTLKLTPGRQAGPYTDKVEKDRIETLKATVAKYLPEFVKAVDSHQEGVDVIQIHQDAFAAGYHTDEYTLLGLAIKYAGLHGVAVTVSGTNGQTMQPKQSQPKAS